jgi:hypothetical protein
VLAAGSLAYGFYGDHDAVGAGLFGSPDADPDPEAVAADSD